ncbi:MAG: twin-arginine translocase TatA/TatE family subunit [Firmicutes bacterium HGW-Firmicutes-14]|nr:MAG: twin-arginine translocase TatA/TatE family subunit [Firmicutes bacterium HGW-Firmicutes-14]
MFNLGFGELALILVIALVVFGPRKLPEVGKAMGRAINEFRNASRDIQNELTEAAKEPEKN